MNVGKLIPANRLPETEFLDALTRLLNSAIVFAKLAVLTQDRRVSESQWQSLLYRELLQLYDWSVSRIMLSAQTKLDVEECPEYVLSLLPRTAIAAHLLRRAIPIAALGIPVVCGFPVAQQAEGTKIAQTLASNLGIEKFLSVAQKGCQQALQSANQEGSLIVVTGRRSTVAHIKGIVNSRVVGCTGRCSVLLGVESNLVMELHNAIKQVRVAHSCNRLRATLLCETLKDISIAYTPFSKNPPITYSVSEILKRLHPSVVFTPQQNSEEQNNIPHYLCGYRVIPCATDGSSPNAIGFAADPIYGWPGDYLL